MRYTKNLYSNKLENLKEMVNCLQTYYLLKLNQYHLPKLNKDEEFIYISIGPSKIESVTKISHHPKHPRLKYFSTEFYLNFKELMSMLLKLFHKIGTEETVYNSFYEDTIALLPKPHQIQQKKENYRAIFLMFRDTKMLQ